MRSLRVMMVVPNLTVGGVETFCSILCRELAKNEGIELYLVVLWGEIDPKFEFLKNDPRIHLLSLGKKKGFSFSFVRNLNSTIKSIAPDIINSHSSHSFRYLLLCRECKKRPLVHVVTNNPFIHNKLAKHLYKFRLHQKRWNIKLIAISDIVAQRLSTLYSYPIENIEIIYNGIEPSDVRPLSRKRQNRFVCCASLTPIKNQSLMIKSFALACQKIPDMTLDLAGIGPEEGNLRRLSEECKVSDKVTFLGLVRLPSALYCQYDYFLLSSKSEGNPLSVVEAMSAGLPVLSTAVGGVPDIVKDGINGYLLGDEVSPESYASCILRLATLSDNDYREISANNVERSKQWDIASIAKDYLRVFEEMTLHDGKAD